MLPSNASKIVIVKQEDTRSSGGQQIQTKSNIKIVSDVISPSNDKPVTTSITNVQPNSATHNRNTSSGGSGLVHIVENDDAKYQNLQEKQKKAYTNLSTRRLMEEEKQVKAAFEKGQLKSEEIPSFKPVMKSGAKDLYEWELVIKGRAGTIWDGGIYKVMLNVPFYFPEKPPKVKFLAPPGKDRFNHIHVYGDGKLCLDLIDPKVFRADVSFIQIAEAIYNIIHGIPNTSSPANLTLNDMYLNDRPKYENLVKEQAKIAGNW